MFDLKDHPTAVRAYALAYERPDRKWRFFAVLDMPPTIVRPNGAVRGAILEEKKWMRPQELALHFASMWLYTAGNIEIHS